MYPPLLGAVNHVCGGLVYSNPRSQSTFAFPWNQARIVLARDQWGNWENAGVAQHNQDRMSPGNLERLRAEYDRRTTREWEAAQMEYKRSMPSARA